MSDVHDNEDVCAGIGHQGGDTTSLRAADWLGLAAAPTFALMALLSGIVAGSPMDMPCSTAHGASPLNGMVPMYGLMSIFHSAPWLKWIACRWRGIRRS
ncbi:hypothetical protein [Rhodanobacter umsongensis]